MRDRQTCPTCEGGKHVLDMHHEPPKRRRCGTCNGRGAIDAGVRPYHPWPAQYVRASAAGVTAA